MCYLVVRLLAAAHYPAQAPPPPGAGPRQLGFEARFGLLPERSQLLADAFGDPDLRVAVLLHLCGEVPVETLGFLRKTSIFLRVASSSHTVRGR